MYIYIYGISQCWNLLTRIKWFKRYSFRSLLSTLTKSSGSTIFFAKKSSIHPGWAGTWRHHQEYRCDLVLGARPGRWPWTAALPGESHRFPWPRGFLLRGDEVGCPEVLVCVHMCNPQYIYIYIIYYIYYIYIYTRNNVKHIAFYDM